MFSSLPALRPPRRREQAWEVPGLPHALQCISHSPVSPPESSPARGRIKTLGVGAGRGVMWGQDLSNQWGMLWEEAGTPGLFQGSTHSPTGWEGHTY